MSQLSRTWTAVATLVVTSGLLASGGALAAGYDTPMLYSARHMGMGGTAIGDVDDPSAMFHNPAGLAQVKGGAVMADFSPLLGQIQGTPADTAVSVKSNYAMSPFFLAAAAYRVTDWLVLGAGVYPVGGAAGGYDYTKNSGKISTVDDAKLSFVELAPAVAVNFGAFRLGGELRMTTTSFDRHVINTENGKEIPYIDLEMKGWGDLGFRLGAQYTAGPFDFGIVYRNRVDSTVKANAGSSHSKYPDYAMDGADAVVTGLGAHDVTFQFILPSKFGAGVAYRATDDLRLAFDFEYTRNSENVKTAVAGTAMFGPGIPEAAVTLWNYSVWNDSQTYRLGAAYTLGKSELRAGFAYDTQATNNSFPTAFGTPPGATTIETLGAGYAITPDLDVSIAGAWRQGSATVSQADIDAQKTQSVDGKTENWTCAFCGKAGDYAINLFGGYVDVRWRFGEPAKTAPAVITAPPADESAPAVEPTPAAPAVAPAPAVVPETPATVPAG
jgi:long-chain fatty acid transport protein